MKLYEFMAKDIYKKYGLPTPQGVVVSNANEVEEKADQIKFPIAAKSQVLTGGRGKAGGIKFAENLEECKQRVNELIGFEIKGIKVEKVLIEQKLDIAEEFYFGVTLDRTARCPVVIVSASGGVNIEEVAKESPEKVIKLNIDPVKGLRTHEANLLMKKIGFSGKKILSASQILQKLYKVFTDYDAELTEINPFVLTKEGSFIAADARLNIDSSSVYRHKEFESQEEKDLTPLESRAAKAGLAYVELDGNIGILGNGAGLVMATLDTVTLNGGKAANFCDLGGGSPRDRVVEGIDILLSNPNVKGVFINILGGITRCDDVAAGLVEYRDQKGIDIPFVVRMVGTNEIEGQEICRNAGIEPFSTMDEASKKIIELIGAGK